MTAVVMVSAVALGSFLSTQHALASPGRSLWSPATGTSLLTLLWVPRTWWRGLSVPLLGAWIVGSLMAGRAPAPSVLISLGGLASAYLVGYLVRAYLGTHLRSFLDLARLLAAVLTGAALGGLCTAAVTASDLPGGFWTAWLASTGVHAVPMLLFAPLAMTRAPWWPFSRVELSAQLSFLVLLMLLMFVDNPISLTATFAGLPLMVWAAFRFGDRVVALESAAFGTVLATHSDLGWPSLEKLADVSASGSSMPQMFLLCLSLTVLSIALAMRQREGAVQRIRASERTFRRNFTASLLPTALVQLDGLDGLEGRAGGVLRFTEVNDACVPLLGRTTNLLAGVPVEKVLTMTGDLGTAAVCVAREGEGGWSGRVGQWDNPRRRLDAYLSFIQQVGERADFSLHFVDVTASLEAQARLEREKNYSRALMDTAGIMVVVATQDGTVIAVNATTTQLTGRSEDELLGRPIWETIVPPGYREATRALFSAKTLLRTLDGVIQHADGSTRSVTCSNGTVTPQDGPPYHVLTGIDVTAERERASMINHLLSSASTVAFVGTDLDGRVTLFNSGAESMLSTDAESAVGRLFASFLLNEPDPLSDGLATAKALPATMARVRSDGVPVTRDCVWVRSTGGKVTVSMTTSTVLDRAGHPIGFLFVARDVSDTRRSQEILVAALRRERDAVSQLRALDSAKDDFISTVSHELRTPMSSIIGTAEMLEDGMVGELTEPQLSMLDVITRNGRRLLTLADDLLALAGFQSGTTRTNHTEVDLRDVVAESLEATAALVLNRSLQVRADVPTDRMSVIADPLQLERALTNLLANAIKFTPDNGTITVCLADECGTAVLSVQDTGIGIPADELHNVFQRFFRSSVVQEQAIQGTGLGLAIVKSIVESHGGSIDVASSEGQGTTFTIGLPLVQHADAAPGPALQRSAAVAAGTQPSAALSRD